MQAIKTKQLFFFCNFLTPKIFELIKCLEINSRIAGYHVFEGQNRVKIFLNYDLTRNQPLVEKIVFFYSRGRKRIVTSPMLQSFHNRYPNAIGIIETRYGIMGSRECAAKNQGGEFIAAIT